MEKYKSYGTLSETTHFLSVFCGAGVVQQCTEAQAGVDQDGFNAGDRLKSPHISPVNAVRYVEQMESLCTGT